MIDISEIKKLTQIIWEDEFSRKEIRKRVRAKLEANQLFTEELENSVNNVVKHFEQNHIFWYQSKKQRWFLLRCMDITIDDLVLEMLLSIFLTGNTTIQTIVGSMIQYFEYKDPFDSAKTASEMLAVIGIKSKLFALVPAHLTESGSIEVHPQYELDCDLKQYIANTMYLPPMLSKPKHIRENYDYDYYNTKSSKILGKGNHHEERIALDVLNIMNSIKLSLDVYMLGFDEKPNSELDTFKKIGQFNRMAKSSKKVYDMLLEQGNQFYNTHKYDKRGRLYSQGYHVHIQSTDYKKSLISLANKEIVPLD